MQPIGKPPIGRYRNVNQGGGVGTVHDCPAMTSQDGRMGNISPGACKAFRAKMEHWRKGKAMKKAWARLKTDQQLEESIRTCQECPWGGEE